MEKSTKTTLTIASIFILVSGAFFIYATGRLEDVIAMVKPKKTSPLDNNNNDKGAGLIPKIQDFPLKEGKKSSKDKVKVVQKYINYKIWGITMNNANFIDIDGIFGKDTKNALVKYMGIDPIITENQYKRMRNTVIEIEKKKPKFFTNGN